MTIGREAPGESRWRVAGNVRRTTRFAPGPAAVILLALAASACSPPAPDLVLINARVFTADPSQPWAEAVAIRGDRITAVGSSAAIGGLADTRTVRRDLAGRTVLPGLNDAHVADPGLPARELRGFLQAAMMSGVTSMQWFVGQRTVSEAGAALVGADSPVRVRVLRMPRPGPDGSTLDSRPHLPPQPSPRVDIRGMGFLFGDDDAERLRQAVGWGYGTEDLIAIEPANDTVLERYVSAVESTGVAEIWAAKQPRVERAGPAATRLAPRLKANGMVVVQRPDGVLPLASLVREGVQVALGSGRGTHPFSTLAWATAPGADQLTMEEAVAAFTRGSARAEHWDGDKGHLSVGALADLVVCSVDPFTASPDQLAGARSTLTVIGGRVVHDVP